MTTKSEGGMLAARREATLGVRYWGEYPCIYLLFRFSNLTGRIVSFGHSPDFFPNSGKYNPRFPFLLGSLIIAHDWRDFPAIKSQEEVTKKRFDDPSLYRIVNKELPEETSARAMRILSLTMDAYNTEYGFNSRDADYDGFSVGNFLDDDSIFI
jgi:hypothetical protein